ncbi:MAG: MBL fold metallo-hydrolase [Deltaproteobacteria bacterium]|nr:MBL fold metallo-hydrolase [Deltaproteobacteria bacterium]MBN2672667.1 MBL fold metallo-hydrolase [Deltaproteobacteria bacterium]
MTKLKKFDLTFLGAAQTVTGSMYLLELDDFKIIVDCGFFQGKRQESAQLNRNIPRVALDADVLLLTHAHIDHSGNIPTLVKKGFKGKVHCTDTTADLCKHMLRDSARIQEHDAGWLNRKNSDDPDWEPITPLYTEDDAVAALEHFVPHPYNDTFDIHPRARVQFVDAGHVLGSASIIIDVQVNGHRRRVVFSGDIGRRNLPILRDPVPPKHADYVIMETTYGNRLHAPVTQMHDQLAAAIEETYKRGGKVIIPSFALERTQEIVFALNELRRSGRIKPIPVYLDSPLAINLTEVFRKHHECYDAEAIAFDLAHGDPFGFDMLKVVESARESMALNEMSGPAIIISASGMCEGGRIVHHLRNNIENHSNAVVIVGYQAQHTLGRRIVERRRQVPVFGVKRDLNARVYVLNAFSAHADKNELLWWATECGSQARKFFLVHGDPEQSEAFAQTLESLGKKCDIPRRKATVSLLD